MKAQKTDVLVIGAGPAGSIAAAILNKKGFAVTVVEQNKFPRFVIGESLLPHCMDLLTEADLLEAVEAKGFQKKFGAKFINGEEICDFNFSEKYTDGWSWTWQVTRADFDKTLIDTAEKRGVEVHYETSVTNVEINEECATTTVTSAEGSWQIHSKYVVDASGYGRVLPKLFGLDTPSAFPPRAAFFAHLKDPLRPDDIDGNRIQVVVLNTNLWVWVIPFSNGNTSIGLVGELDTFLEEGKSPEENFQKLISSHEMLKSRFGSPEFIFEPRTLSGYACAVKKYFGNRFVLVGNSTEFLDPIFSSGVTFALESGAKAANLIARELNNEEVNWEVEFVEHMKQGIDTFRAYVNAWYDGTLQTIFFARNIDQGVQERICSVLAGYVWDKTNPYVSKPVKALQTLATVIKMG